LQVEQFLESIDTNLFTIAGSRDYALLYASGLLLSALANPDWKFFNSKSGIIRCDGKVKKTRLVPVGRKACEALAPILARSLPEFCAPCSSHPHIGVL